MLNPITYSERVVSDFLRYQFTTYAFADPSLNEQMRRLLSLQETRETPLMQGPYVSLSRSFREGASLRDLVDEHVLHPHLPNLAPHERVYGHQEKAIRALAAGRTTLISTGTGSGKTECFLYPTVGALAPGQCRGGPAGSRSGYPRLSAVSGLWPEPVAVRFTNRAGYICSGPS